MGIDGYSFMEQLPVQVKQSERVGRGVVDSFETAIERAGKHKGYVIAFTFTRGAKEEAARAKTARGVEVVLVEVERLLQGHWDTRPTPQLEELFPKLPDTYLDMPLPKPRPRSARPSAEALVRSDRQPENQHA